MTVDEIARLAGGHVTGDGSQEILGIAALESAGEQDLTFAEGERALAKASDSRAGCILVQEEVDIPGHTIVAVKHPKMAFIRAAAVLRPPAQPAPGIHPTALIAADALLGRDVSVGPYVVIERGTSVGDGSVLGAGVFLGEGVSLGSNCLLHARVSVYAGVRIGNRVILHSGVVLGSDGFGYVYAEGRHHKFPQVGGLIVENDVEIGSNSTLDRGSLGTTVIGEGTKIDNLVQIAHNVKIGRHSIIAAQTGISGSVEVGDHVVMGGQVGVADHVRIGERAIVGAQAGIPSGKIVRKDSILWGTPARPLAEFKKMYAHLSRLPALAEKVRELYSKSARARED